MHRASNCFFQTRAKECGAVAQIIQMPPRTRRKQSLVECVSNKPDYLQALDDVKQAIGEMTASVDQLACMVQQLQNFLYTVELTIDELNNPAEKMLFRDQYQLLRASLSAAIGGLQREVRKLPELHIELREGVI